MKERASALSFFYALPRPFSILTVKIIGVILHIIEVVKMELFEKKFKLKNLYVGQVATQSEVHHIGCGNEIEYSYSDHETKFFVEKDNRFFTAVENIEYPISDMHTCHRLGGKRVIIDATLQFYADKYPQAYKGFTGNNIKSFDRASLKDYEESLNTMATVNRQRREANAKRNEPEMEK